MAVFCVTCSGTKSDRLARAAVAGRRQLAGVCGGIDVLRVCAAEQWIRGSSCGEIPANAIAGIRNGNSGWNSWGGFWKLFAVGHGGWIQIGARPRGHGHGRRENDGHDRGVSRLTRDVSDAAGGEFAGKLHCDWPGAGAVPRGLETRSRKTSEPPGTW